MRQIDLTRESHLAPRKEQVMNHQGGPLYIVPAIAALIILGVLSACSSQSSGMPAAALDDLESWDLLWITDTMGINVPHRFAAMIEEDTGKSVTVDIVHDSSLDIDEVLNALTTGESDNFKLSQLADLIPDAEIIVFWAFPSEFYEPDNPFDWKCHPHEPFYVDSCSAEDFDSYRESLSQVYQRFFELRAGQSTIVRTIDAASIRVAEWKASGVYEACRECWGYLDDAMRDVAESFNIPQAPLVEAFNGANWEGDPEDKGYIRLNFEPNEVGAEVIAQLLRELGYEPVIP
jgi:hypothetical protein